MSETLTITAIVFLAGFIWSFRRPAGSCMLSTDEQHALKNRITSGLINGTVLGGISFVITKVVFG